MSVTPTPSVSSGETRFFDALVMQFSYTDNATGAGQGSHSPNPRPGAPGNSSSTNQRQPSRTENTQFPSERAGDEVGQKTPSLRSLPTEESTNGQEKQTFGMKATLGGNGEGNGLGRKASVRTTTSTRTTTSAFANGAPLTAGRNTEHDDDENLIARSAIAERSLSQKQKDRITKEEKKESKTFSKLLKRESTTEQAALGSALKTLSSLQSLHKAAMKREAKAEASHASALSAAQVAESRYHEEKARAAESRARVEARCMEERARWEGREGQALAQQERLSSARETVKEVETRIAECAREVEKLRIVKATDEREREARLTELARQK